MAALSNNDILRRLRYTFDFSDEQMIDIYEQADVKVTRSLISDWLKPETDADYKEMHDNQLAAFLNGFINLKRGKKEGVQPPIEKTLNNNLILKKLKIALTLKTEDIVELFELTDLKVSNTEITAFLRNPKQPQYRPFMDQFLRNFMLGLQIKHRGK
ncbi:DUF1456 family protein [Marivirga atlantica]|jgi:uncharacterized protein YehS (DUF1456 family)|uniref:DUF1456 family protein n=1 Tax=Marivirga atlantica TaxID=1548457 RepID=A0A937DI74_9BACT|nr:DUF1456 family protein [Marivirga atlantica]MBL0764735.1 DUF1456 family protein [Marivirga atlantica]